VIQAVVLNAGKYFATFSGILINGPNNAATEAMSCSFNIGTATTSANIPATGSATLSASVTMSETLTVNATGPLTVVCNDGGSSDDQTVFSARIVVLKVGAINGA
jgi:hypothetical protein